VGTLLVVNLVLTFAIPGISIGGHLGGLAAGTTVGALMTGARTGRHAAVGFGAALLLSTAVVAAAVIRAQGLV
jgi:hypothetical protein